MSERNNPNYPQQRHDDDAYSKMRQIITDAALELEIMLLQNPNRSAVLNERFETLKTQGEQSSATIPFSDDQMLFDKETLRIAREEAPEEFRQLIEKYPDLEKYIPTQPPDPHEGVVRGMSSSDDPMPPLI